MNYEKFPATKIKGHENELLTGWGEIKPKLTGDTVVMDVYPGVDEKDILNNVKDGFDVIINARDIYKDKDAIETILQPHVTEDRVFGTMFYGVIDDLIDENKLAEEKRKLEKAESEGKRVLVFGPGAARITKGDQLVYVDMSRWEIQLRYRKGMPNFFFDNPDEDPLRKIKRGFFIEWRVFDKHKNELFEDIDFFIDANTDTPKMAPGKAVLDGLAQIAQQPFRTVPYFDPGVWGGQWMKEVCGLDKDKANYAWSFDGVPEENAILLDFENGVLELPSMDLILRQPKEVLGPKVFARFGAEFPIRFDFLDTMGGQNLSLQVHPLTEYMHRTFGMAYTQDESYYILDAGEDAHVYLGLKEGVDKEEMFKDLEEANRGEHSFDAEKYINNFPAKKHDHFLIPAGTLHCSGSNSMVLEISATPYIFTFKLWDWDRVGLDGKPRPVHLAHGKKNVQWDRTTPWVKENLVNAIYTVEENDQYKEEHTGLHELEFIETRRYWTKGHVDLDTKNNVNMLNLVEGKRAIISSPDNKFEPYEVHYAETFILPAAAGRYTITSPGGEQIGVIRAYVRN